jgi:anaerobic ribonucleoside-triphosphate reductase
MNTKTICHDCKKELKLNEKFMQYEVDGSIFAKCEVCHKKDPILRNFRKTEVYSRVVGYIRPVQQWHEGKQAEFVDRKEFCVEGC